MTNEKDRPPGDEARDAHLLAALRHAPDHDLSPSPALSAAILERARAAARGRSRQAASSWRTWLDPLVRPPWAAAFGTLAVAGVLGLMWSTQDVPEVSLRPDAVGAKVAPVAAPAEAPVPVRETSADAVARSAAATAPVRPPVRPPEPEAPRQRPTGAAVESNVAPASALAPSLPTPMATQVAQGNTDTASASGGLAERRRAADASPATPAPAVALKAAAESPDPLLRIDALLSGTSGVPTWQLGGRALPHGAEQRAWWTAVSQSTRGRWQRDDPPTGPWAPWLRLYAGAANEALLWSDGDQLRLRLGNEWWKATVPPTTLQEWQAMVARW